MTGSLLCVRYMEIRGIPEKELREAGAQWLSTSTLPSWVPVICVFQTEALLTLVLLPGEVWLPIFLGKSQEPESAVLPCLVTFLCRLSGWRLQVGREVARVKDEKQESGEERGRVPF